MATVFGPEWSDLDFADIEAFFAEDPQEGLTWEAKGSTLPRAGSILKHSSGFANQLGGFLVLGVSRDEGAWILDGLQFPDGEPATWLSSILTGGLRPRPLFDVKSWRVGESEKRDVSVLRVSPVAEPPCMTKSGTVFERVSGQTIPVTDPSVLLDLQGRGEQARRSAIRRADAGLEQVMTSEWVRKRPSGFALTASSVSQGIDLASVVMSPETEAFVRGLPVSAGLFGSRSGKPAHLNLIVRQDGLYAVGDADFNAWSLYISRDGAVAVMCAYGHEKRGVDVLWEEVVEPAARAVSASLEALGAYGATFVRFLAEPWSAPKMTLSTPTTSASMVRTEAPKWSDEPQIETPLLEDLGRELLWAAGIRTWTS